MAKAHEELTNPQTWLQRLTETADGFAKLISESGGPARAAYRMARARCRAESATGQGPTLEDLQAAARLLAARVGRGGALPIKSVLASDADSSGLHALNTTVQGALRSLPPPAPSSQQRRATRGSARTAEARSRPSAPHQ